MTNEPLLFPGKPWEFRGRKMERNAPRGTRCTPGCTHPRPGLNTKMCICTVCHEAFGVPANFDRHRKDGWCLNPAEIGLTRDEYGYWRVTMDTDVRDALRATETPGMRHQE
jgi:hypothetical protein